MMHATNVKGPATLMSILVMLGLMLTRAEAGAQPRGAVIVTGAADPHARGVIAATIEGVVKEASWSLVDQQQFSPADVEKIVACLGAERPWPCLDTNELTKGAERFVVVQAGPEPRGSAAETVITAKLVVAGETVPSIERDSCTRCSDDDLARLAKVLTTKLLDNTAARSGHGTLDVRTTPPGASVSIDGKMLGESNHTYFASPGRHTVLLVLAGYQPETRIITIKEGQTESLAITLDPESESGDHRLRNSIIAGGVGGAGLIMLVAGTYVSWTADAGLTGPQPKYEYSAPGIAVAVAGGALVGVGVYLWIRASKQSSTPTVSFVPGGGIAGWATSF